MIVTVLTALNAVFAMQADVLQAQPVEEAASDVTVEAPQPLQRVIGLDELGYSDGAKLAGPAATQTLYFPVPRDDADYSARLTLDFETRSALAAQRTLSVSADGRPLELLDVSQNGNRTLSMAIPPDAAQNGFLRLDFEYRSALTEFICMDQRLAADFVWLNPATSLEVTYRNNGPDTLADFLQERPRNTVFVLDDLADAAALSAAMTLANTLPTGTVSFATSGPADQDDLWGTTRIRVTNGAPDAYSLQPVPRNGPALVFSADQRAPLATLAATRWAGVQLAGTDTPLFAAPAAAEGSSLPLDAFPGAEEAFDVVDTSTWGLSYNLTDHGGRRPQSVALDIATAEDTSDMPVVASLFFNQVLLDSVRLQKSGVTRLSASLPKDLVYLDNEIQLVVQRQPTQGECRYAPAGFPVQVLPTSRIGLTDVNGAVAHFADLATSFSDGVSVHFGDTPDADSLSYAALLTDRLVAPGQPVNVQTTLPSGDAPFIFVGRTAPEGMTAPGRFDEGRVAISLEGEDLLSFSEGTAITAIQLVTIGGQKGLWLRLPAAFEVPDQLSLGRADVILADDTGPRLTFDSAGDQQIRIDYADRTSVWEFLEKWRIWIIAAAWLLFTILVIYALRALFKRRSESGKH